MRHRRQVLSSQGYVQISLALAAKPASDQTRPDTPIRTYLIVANYPASRSSRFAGNNPRVLFIQNFTLLSFFLTSMPDVSLGQLSY